MRAWIVSDMHVDVMSKYRRHRENKEPLQFIPPKDAEVAILAGDIAEGVKGIEWAEKLVIPAYIIPGNHEYYWRILPDFDAELRAVAEQTSNVTFLNCDRADVGNIRLLGCCLWTDYLLEGFPVYAMRNCRALSDHSVIAWREENGSTRGFTPHDARKIHVESRAWLERELVKPHDGPTVVITHHAPHIQSVHEVFLKNSNVNAAFASDLSDILKKYDIDLWIHGHTHCSFDYEVFGTRIVCNPYGYYPTAETQDFDPNLVIEI